MPCIKKVYGARKMKAVPKEQNQRPKNKIGALQRRINMPAVKNWRPINLIGTEKKNRRPRNGFGAKSIALVLEQHHWPHWKKKNGTKNVVDRRQNHGVVRQKNEVALEENERRQNRGRTAPIIQNRHRKNKAVPEENEWGQNRGRAAPIPQNLRRKNKVALK